MARRVWQCEGCLKVGTFNTCAPCLNECGTEVCDSCANYGNCPLCHAIVSDTVQKQRWVEHIDD